MITASLVMSLAAYGGDDTAAILKRRSPAPQPYAYVSGGRLAAQTVDAAPDPMVSYVSLGGDSPPTRGDCPSNCGDCPRSRGRFQTGVGEGEWHKRESRGKKRR